MSLSFVFDLSSPLPPPFPVFSRLEILGGKCLPVAGALQEPDSIQNHLVQIGTDEAATLVTGRQAT